MEKATVDDLSEQGRSDALEKLTLKKDPQEEQLTVNGKGWLKGALGMAICCAAPLLLFAAIALFGLSLGAIASGALSLVALLACPIGMFLMMRMMSKNDE